METRIKTEVKIYGLRLNPMQGNTETQVIVAISYERDRLENWYKAELVEPYEEEGSPSFPVHGDSHKWYKNFRKDGPLEWFNPCNSDFSLGSFGHGIFEEWVNEEVPNACGILLV